MDKLHEEQSWLTTGSLVVLAVVATGFSLSYTRGVLVPFVLAIFVASVASPLIDFQVVRLRFSRIAAVIITLLVLVMVFIGFGLIVLNSLQNIVRSVGGYSSNIVQLGNDFLRQLEVWHIPVDGAEILEKLKDEVPRFATSVTGIVTSILSQGLLVFIFVGFLLASRDPHVLRAGVYADIDKQIRRYIGTKLVISGVTGLLVWACLYFLKVELASVFGLLAFMLNFIPSVGSIISTLLPLPTAVAQFPDKPWIIALVVLIPGTIQMTIGNVIEPKLMGGGMKLHPVTILLSLAVWGLLWGPIGMLLAVPMTAALRIVLEQFQITQSTSQLLAGTLPGTNQMATASNQRA